MITVTVLARILPNQLLCTAFVVGYVRSFNDVLDSLVFFQPSSSNWWSHLSFDNKSLHDNKPTTRKKAWAKRQTRALKSYSEPSPILWVSFVYKQCIPKPKCHLRPQSNGWRWANTMRSSLAEGIKILRSGGHCARCNQIFHPYTTEQLSTMKVTDTIGYQFYIDQDFTASILQIAAYRSKTWKESYKSHSFPARTIMKDQG